MTSSTHLDPQNPYFELQSLFELAPNGQGLKPIQLNPKNQKPIPFNDPTKITDQTTYFTEFNKLPEHLQKQVTKLQELQKQTAALATNPSETLKEPTKAKELPDSGYPKTQTAAHKARVLKNAPRPTEKYSFKVGKTSVEMRHAIGKPSENGIYFPIKVDPTTWKTIEKLYTKYLIREDLDLPNQNIRVTNSSFYTSLENETKTYFEIQFYLDKTLESRRILVDFEDLSKINILKQSYPNLTTIAPSPRNIKTYKRFFISNKELEKTTHTEAKLKAGDDACLFLKYEKAVKKANSMRRSHDAQFTHPLTSKEILSTEEGAELIQNFLKSPIDQAAAEITFHTERDQVETYKESQYLFSKSAHKARVFYGISPRFGKSHSELSYEEMLRLAENYPLHMSLNANVGELLKSEAPQFQNHTSLVIHTKHKIHGASFATLIQDGIEIPDIESENETLNQNELAYAIIDQVERYQELIKGFTGSKTVSVREPLNRIGVNAKGDIFPLNTRLIKLSAFIRIIAAYLTNLKSQGSSKIKLEFEYSLDESGRTPIFLDEVKKYSRNLIRELSQGSFNLEKLTQDYLSGNLDLNDHDCLEKEETPPHNSISSRRANSTSTNSYTDPLQAGMRHYLNDDDKF